MQNHTKNHNKRNTIQCQCPQCLIMAVYAILQFTNMIQQEPIAYYTNSWCLPAVSQHRTQPTTNARWAFKHITVPFLWCLELFIIVIINGGVWLFLIKNIITCIAVNHDTEHCTVHAQYSLHSMIIINIFLTLIRYRLSCISRVSCISGISGIRCQV